MGKILFILFVFCTISQAYDIRIPANDTTLNVVHPNSVTGSKASTLSVATSGAGVSLNVLIYATIIDGIDIGINNIEIPGLMLPGMLLGLVGIISGCIGLSKYRKLNKKGLNREGMKKARATKAKSILGIVLGVIAVALSIGLIALDSSFI